MCQSAKATCIFYVFFYVTDWTLVFRGTRGNGVDIYNAWVSGTSVTTTDETCKVLEDNSCTDHYRNPIVDSWGSTGVVKVK